MSTENNMDATMTGEAGPSTSVPREMAPSAGGRAGGKSWKTQKTATKRSYISPSIKSSFATRQVSRTKHASMKALETELKDEKAAEELAKRLKIKERRDRKAEREREEELKRRMGEKRAQRLKKRQGRTKKVNG